jgi:glycosyltransferase involved in cell wall biosynthesis
LKYFNPIVHKTVIALGEFAGYGAKNETYIVGAIDTDKLISSGIKPKRPYIAGHYPSNSLVKGTETINKIAGNIKGIKYLCSVEKVTYEEQLKRMAVCDIYIELFNPVLNGEKYGSFGISALEAAAMGKIVVTQNLSHKVYKENYGYCPLILCETENDLREKLELLGSMKPNEIKHLQDKTREWVVKNHSYKATGERILKNILC